MATDEVDEFVPFQNVRVIRSSASGLLCRIGQKSAWLPRQHISGKLWSTGDRGRLLIRRWIARDRHLIDRNGAAIESPVPLRSRPRLAAHLHLVQGDRITQHAKQPS